MGERRYSELEQALEIKSLRRIISAYLNYPDAAEEDVRRYERSFRKLSPTHKALLSYLPLKFQRIRRCISVNSYFIMSMLQAFEPPLDMSIDIDEDEHLENTAEHYHPEIPRSSERSNWSRHSESITESNSLIPEPSTFRGENSLPRDDMRSDDKELNGNAIMDGATISHAQKKSCGSDKDSVGVAAVPAAHCCGSSSNGNVNSSRDWMDPSSQLNVPPVDVDKVRCIIRNIVRDWAQEGQKERDQCYKPILEELNHHFPDRREQSPPSCLVPGAGLGRLALEISCLGFVSQGNEFSYYMMICSSFILNHTQEAYEWTIYPWIHSNCNSLSDNDQLRPVSFPDVHPASAGITDGFSMCGGDFVEVYNDESQEASWDSVVTCFFLDTAHNIVEYIEIISKILKDGGVWINLGPLLYHFADSYGPEDEMSIELSLEDVKKVAYHYGFEMEMEKMIETTYTANMRSMMQNRYNAAFWTMRKKPQSRS
ncbi:carnosine N-methyltransferase isoform X2 [Ananas comosus]|uniref:carnosine N-methyltransferase n=1 Tax=Ananas comosus TaxID=4615 RepID=A0A6P5EU27_ANACO|nr:carnosine N-methyltransferase isoform X2 [Ananas comosus]